MDESYLQLTFDELIITFSEVLKFVSETVNGAKVLVSNSFLSAYRHECLRAVVATHFE